MKPLLFALTLATTAAVEPVDLLLVNGTVHTMDPKQPTAEAIGVTRGRIVFVGSNREAEAYRASALRLVDLTGATVVPGLNDAHLHLAGIGFRELSFDLEGTKGIADLQAKLKAQAAQAKPGQWIVGRGWIETHWSPAVFPTARDLDEAAPNHPVALERADGHATVVNSLALKLARIDRTTPNPPGGEILRHADSGEATGMLIDTAASLVDRLVPPPTQADVEKALIVASQREVALGWTAVQIAGHGYDEAELVRRLVADGKVKLRIYDAVSAPGPDAERLFADGPVVGESDGRYTRRGVKLYMDGALGSRGAALLAPYSDYPQSSGLLMKKEEELRPFLAEALRRGIQVQTHAIGDRGNRLVLDLYQSVFTEVMTTDRRVPEPRWRIEHAQIIDPVDIPRFAQLGVIASMQPSHAIGDLFFAPQRLGPARLAGAYAWQSLLRSGAVIAAGSDAPVERGEPMIEFYAAVARRSLDGFANEDWRLEQRMSREQALRALTLDAAYAAFEEKERGSIEAGKRADLTVLSADIMRIPEPDILKTRCLMTVIGGEVVYAAPK